MGNGFTRVTPSAVFIGVVGILVVLGGIAIAVVLVTQKKIPMTIKKKR